MMDNMKEKLCHYFYFIAFIRPSASKIKKCGTASKSGAKFDHKGGTEALLKLHLYRLFNPAQRWHECIYTTVVAVNVDTRDEVGQSRPN